MKHNLKRLLPILLGLVIICSLIWYLFSYDRSFTREILLQQARRCENNGKTAVAAWIYDLAYEQSNGDENIAIELAQQFKANGNYTKAEVTLSKAIAQNSSAALYVELCKTYVEQDKLLDAVSMLDHITDETILSQLASVRPAAPAATPDPGYYNQYINVTITSSENTTLYITTNGNYPSTADTPSDGTLTLGGGETILYALSIGDNGLVSPLTVVGYTVSGVVEEITISDSKIDTAVRSALSLTESDTLYSNDLWTITQLDLPEGADSYLELSYLPYLESLTISGSKTTSLEGINSLSGLQTLSITDSSLQGDDLLYIAALPNLETLTLSDCGLASVENLSDAKNLVYLDLSNNSIRDFTALAFMSQLTELNLSHNALTTLNALSGLSALKTLDVSYNSLTSLTPVAGCSELTVLRVNNNAIDSLSGVTNLSLTELNAGFNKLTDVTPICNMTTLVDLDLSSNSLTDISGLSELNALQNFLFSRNAVTALPGWRTDCALITIDGSYNDLTNIDVLSGMLNLNSVLMDYNNISNVNSLKKCSNLITVSVYGNPVTDVSALTDSSIIVNYNPLG